MLTMGLLYLYPIWLPSGGSAGGAPGPVVVQSAVGTSVPAATGADSITVNVPNDRWI